jgi:hypothetical protein
MGVKGGWKGGGVQTLGLGLWSGRDGGSARLEESVENKLCNVTFTKLSQSSFHPPPPAPAPIPILVE